MRDPLDPTTPEAFRYKRNRDAGLDLDYEDEEGGGEPVVEHRPRITIHRVDNIYVGECDGYAVLVGVVLPSFQHKRAVGGGDPLVIGWHWISGREIDDDPRPAAFRKSRPSLAVPLTNQTRRAYVNARMRALLGPPDYATRCRAGTAAPSAPVVRPEPVRPATPYRPANSMVWICKVCRVQGHTRRWCPQLAAEREQRIAERRRVKQHQDATFKFRLATIAGRATRRDP